MAAVERRGARGFTLVELLLGMAVVAGLVWLGLKVFPMVWHSDANTEEVIVGTYSPTMIPVSISVDSSGKLKVAAAGTVVTPVGVFSVEWERRKLYYLEVTLGTETRFYPLGKKEFKVDLPNTLRGQSRVTYDGVGNVRIIIPDPGRVRFP